MLRRLVMLILLVGFFAAAAWFVVTFPDRPQGRHVGTVSLVISRGASFKDVLAQLNATGSVSHPWAFIIYARLRGATHRVQAGTVEFNVPIAPRELLDTLMTRVRPEQIAVTIPEGVNMFDVAALVSSAGIAERNELLRLMHDGAFLQKLGIPAASAEGFLFPDTYLFVPRTSAQDVLTRFVRRHQEAYRAIVQELGSYNPYRDMASVNENGSSTNWLEALFGWNSAQIVTMASIIEKEAANDVERPIIASVFLNRLLRDEFQPKILQADPTIRYGCIAAVKKSAACADYDGRILKKHLLDRDNPYNTYVHVGLPPGPICNPGRASLAALFAPAQTRYLYFVSRNNGTHEFAETLTHHNHAVDRFQRKRRRSPRESISQ